MSHATITIELDDDGVSFAVEGDGEAMQLAEDMIKDTLEDDDKDDIFATEENMSGIVH